MAKSTGSVPNYPIIIFIFDYRNSSMACGGGGGGSGSEHGDGTEQFVESDFYYKFNGHND